MTAVKDSLVFFKASLRKLSESNTGNPNDLWVILDQTKNKNLAT